MTDRNRNRSNVGVRGMSARLARSLTGTRAKTNPVLDPLLSIHRQFHPRADAELLSRAYDLAETLHEGVFRKSGDPYITHPLAVATIAAEIGISERNTITSGMIPSERSSFTLCCVGFVLISPDARKYGTSVVWM